MIEYVEIRNASRELVGIVDTAKSIIWKAEYYGAGSFEIYAPATAQYINLLQVGNYVTRINDDNVGVIEGINNTYNAQDGRMIIASGRFAKSLLDRRLIYNLSGNSLSPIVSSGLAEVAVRRIVDANIISSAQTARNISFIKLGTLQNITKQIVDENGDATQKQTSFDNLLTYTDELLKEFELGAYMSLNRDTLNLEYNVYDGADRSASNAAGNVPIIFSQDFDNLLSSSYDYQTAALKNTALIGGEGEGTDRFCTMIGVNATGLNRREVWIDAGGQSRKYKDNNDAEKTYTNAEYTALLQSHGRQQLATLQTVETFDGEIDMTNSGLVYGTSYWVGDIVTIQDVDLGIFKNARIVAVAEVQDENGYSIDISYGV